MATLIIVAWIAVCVGFLLGAAWAGMARINDSQGTDQKIVD